MKLIKNKKACLPARQGFTLVELLLVMAIIGILAGIVFIMIGPARKKARVTAFKKTMSDITAAATDCVDNGGSIIENAPGSPLCQASDGGGDYGIGNIPIIKSCGGGGNLTNVLKLVDPDNANMDDFAITYTCPISGNTIVCKAYCDINGCKFDNDDADGVANDGCPKVK